MVDKKMGMTKSPAEQIRSSAVEYLTLVAASGQRGVEAVCADETIWLTQKMMSALYELDVVTINCDLKEIFDDNELQVNSVIRKYRITAGGERKDHLNRFIKATDYAVLDAGCVTAEISKTYAQSEFEKYRVIQGRLLDGDFARLLKQPDGTLISGKDGAAV